MKTTRTFKLGLSALRILISMYEGDEECITEDDAWDDRIELEKLDFVNKDEIYGYQLTPKGLEHLIQCLKVLNPKSSIKTIRHRIANLEA